MIAYTYDADDNAATIAYPDAYLYTYAYDEVDRMIGVSETQPGGSIATLATYSYESSVTLGSQALSSSSVGTLQCWPSFAKEVE